MGEVALAMASLKDNANTFGKLYEAEDSFGHISSANVHASLKPSRESKKDRGGKSGGGGRSKGKTQKQGGAKGSKDGKFGKTYGKQLVYSNAGRLMRGSR